MNELPTGTLLVLLGLLLILSAFFSSSETSLLSLDRHRLKRLTEEGNRSARRVSKLLKRKDRLLGLVLIGNNIVNISASVLATLISLRLWGSHGPLLATVLLTLYILIFAEIGPKTIAAMYPEKIAFPASLLLKPANWLLSPLVWLFTGISNITLRLIGINPSEHKHQAIDREELMGIINATEARLNLEHRNMLNNILALEEILVRDIMIARSDVISLNIKNTEEQMKELIAAGFTSRIVVYENEMENIIGVLDIRDIAFAQEKISANFLRNQLRAVHYTLENATLLDQLSNFKKEKSNLAIVVDEYGAIQGIVTLQDILHEIIGRVSGEQQMDSITRQIRRYGDGSYLIGGLCNIRDINRELNWSLPNEATTLNGLLLEYMEDLPKNCVCVKIGNYRIEVLNLSKNRILQTRISREIPKQEQTAPEDAEA